MAGYLKIYCIGGLGGFQGADGINPITMQIWVGYSDRQWFEPHYFEPGIRPLGSVKCLIPEGPDHPHALVDACIAFYPRHFRDCPSLPVIAERLAGVERLDFHLGKDAIPKEWPRLRKEAWPLFQTLHILEGDLRPIKLQEESL